MAKIIDKDVLVIGAGIAGLSAAIHTANHAVSVLLVNKGLLGRQSCSVGSAFWGSVYTYPPPYTAEQEWERRKRSGAMGASLGGLSNQEIQREIFLGGAEASRELEEMGLYFRRTDEGNLMYLCPIGRGETVGLTPEIIKKAGLPLLEDQGNATMPYGLITPRFGGTGFRVTATLREQVQRLGIEYLEETPVIRLLTNNGEVVGAVAIDLKTGELIVIRSKSVILAAGGVGAIVPYITCTREMACDGYAMAYRAGAEMMDLAVGQMWHHADVGCAAGKGQWPDCWFRFQIYPYSIPMSQDHPYFVNEKGERFIKEIEVAAPYESRALSTAFQTKRGLAPFEWGAYVDLGHWDPVIAKDVWTQWDYLEKLDIDPKKEKLQTGMSYHWNFGGVRTNEKMESTLPGLYVAGGNAHSGGTQTGAYVTGKIAAKNAAERALQMNQPNIDWQQVEAEQERLQTIRSVATKTEGYLPIQIKQKIREVMWEHMHMIKHEKTMLKTLEELQKIRTEMIPRLRLSSDTRIYNSEVIEAIDVEFMLDYCELYTQVCLFRKESRGPFYREDYPLPDNKNWLTHVVGKLDKGKLNIYTTPVEQPYYQIADTIDHWDPQKGVYVWVSQKREIRL